LRCSGSLMPTPLSQRAAMGADESTRVRFLRKSHRVFAGFASNQSGECHPRPGASGALRNSLHFVQAGLGGRWPHAKPDDPGGAPWKDLCAEILRHDNRMLLILGANGVETFGRPGSPLFDVMQKFLGQTRVILIDANSNHAAGRAATVNQTVSEYKRAISASAKRLRDLRHQQHSIDGRYYDGLPNWKMIITSRTAWIQYYVPGQHVAETPVWRFDSTEEGSGLYNLFAMEFERIWRRCEHNEMALN
jgi:hypothetical protein